MADYDIYREQLAIKYPSYGYALWDPSPSPSDGSVQVGDVGFIRQGKFHRLFNALLPADDPSHERGVPESHEPLVPVLSDHLDTGFLRQNDYCSAGVSAEPDPGHYSKGPDDIPKVSFQNRRTRGAAVLSLPVTARREDTLAHVDFKWWIVKHIDSWLAFAGKLGVMIDQMEEIILVTGCHRVRSWANVAFLENQVDAQVTFGMKVEGPDNSIEFQIPRGNAQGAVLRLGPEGTNLPENQCVFIRGFRVARSPRRLKAAARPSPDLGYDCDPDTEVKSIPVVTKRDPLHLLLEYIAEQASDCDIVLVHDDDLVTIDGLGHDASLESLEPEVMMDLLRTSNIDIDKVLCDLPPTDNDPSADTPVVKVAMVSMKSQNLNSNIGSQSQRSPLAGQNADLGSSDPRGSSPSAVPGSLPVPTIRGDTSKRKTSPLADHGDSALSTSQDLADITLHGLGEGTDPKDALLAPGKIIHSLSHLWPSLSKFAHVVRDRLLITVVLTFCAVSLFGWMFLFNWAVEFKLFLTLLLASVPLSVWLEHEYMCRCRLDGMSGLESLQHRVRLAGVLRKLTEDPKQIHTEPEAAGPIKDKKQVHAELGAVGVPVSFADCRNCPNPCEDGHEEYPRRIASMIDTTSDMLGTVKPYRRQVVISTGEDDWEHTVTEVQGSLASYISDIKNAEPLTSISPSNLPIEGIFKDSENHAVGILNGSHKTLSYDDHETVLVFPDYKVLTEVPRSLDGARELWRNSVNPSVSRLGSFSGSSSVRSWVIPYTCVILICSHGKRDARCAVVAPILERAFTQNLLSEGWDVHTKLEDPTGSPLEDYHDEHEKDAEFSRRLKELDEDSSKRALILMTSHITGHKYAGNVIIYMPHGAGVWYGRVSAHEVASIVHTTIIGGRILLPLLRGGVNLARPDCKGLNDW